MKVLFLDIDGVVAPPENKWNIVPEKISLIRKICEDTDCKIVISSSWRRDTLKNTKEAFRRRLHKMFKKHPDVEWFVENIYDITPYTECARGHEIERYLNEHEVDKYVILDDDSDMLDEQLYHFVHVDWGIGLTEREVELAIKILNHQYIFNLLGLNDTLKYQYRLHLDDLPNRYESILQYNDLNRDLK